MNFRQATDNDLAFAGKHSISHGCFSEMPEITDYVYTLDHEGVVLAVGGLKMMNPWSAWAWFDLTGFAMQYKTVVFRTIRSFLDGVMQEKKIERIMAAVEVDFDRAIRTAERLGFEREGLMPRFMGSKAAYMYVRYGEK